MNLIYRHEGVLKVIALSISIIFWLALVLGTFGIALLYFLLIFIAYLFAQSGFISYLKGTAIKVSASQHPDLHDRLLHCCKTIGLEPVPDCYLLRTNTFNAVATRFLGRNFVVLFADVVDALAERPDAINFYIGHELGHIHRKHLQLQVVTLPASVLPLLGAGYHRAREYTCDRYGLVCCKDLMTANEALVAIAAGNSRFASTSADAFVGQDDTGTFWMSFHELIGDYPWLTKRVSAIGAAVRGEEAAQPSRNFFAWVLALFVPRLGVAGGGGSALIVIAIIGILAAIAIPAYQDYMVRSQITAGLNGAAPFKAAVTRYVIERQEWPTSAADLGDTAPVLDPNAARYASVEIVQDGAIIITYGTSSLAGHTVTLAPAIRDHQIVWRCYSEDTPAKWLPVTCR